tara:strand:+ start:493 stop:1284 length:792 start_codon:yes stop_codon:yes gene_type:complete
MPIKINGTNTAANPSITGSDTDTGIVYGSDQIDFSIGGASKVTIDSSGRVHIGTATNRLGEALHVLGQGITTSSAENTNMGLFGTFGGSDLLIGTFNSNNVVVRRGNNNVARFTADGFIPNGTDTAAANALDVYEEGTWTAILNGGNFTATQNSFRYTKIGRQVTVFGQIYNFSSSTNPSNIEIGGLPFTTSSQAVESGSVVFKKVDIPSGQAESIGTTASSNSTNMFFAFCGKGGSSDLTLRYSDLNSTGAAFLFCHTYSVS